MSDRQTPPGWASKFLAWFCKPDLLETIEGDLEESFEDQLSIKGLRQARRTYIKEVFRLFRPGITRSFWPQPLSINTSMWKNYTKIAIRQVGRHKLFTGLNILGLATSMSVCLLIIMILTDQYSYDQFHENKDRIYRVIGDCQEHGSDLRIHYASSPMPISDRLEEAYPWVEHAIPLAQTGRNLTTGEKTHQFNGLWADGRMLSSFTFGWMEGDEQSALSNPNQIVLTLTTANALFKGENPIGQSIGLDLPEDFIVTGIIPDPPLRSHIQFDYLLSYSSLPALERQDLEPKRVSNWDNAYQGHVYFMAKEGTSRSLIAESLSEIAASASQASEFNDFLFVSQPLAEVSPGDINLGNQMGMEFPRLLLYILSGLSALILILACLNYTNLSIARAMKRAREIGIRKVVGAKRGQIITQFLVESVLVSFLSLFLAVCMLEFLIRGFFDLNPFIGQFFNLDRSPAIYGMFIGFALFVGILAGLLPALQLSRFKPIVVLKKLTNLKLFSYLGLRKTLVVIQFVFSLLFILTTVILIQQQEKLLSVDLGLSTENIVNISLQGVDYDQLAVKLAQIPGVSAVTGSTIIPAKGWNIGLTVTLPGGGQESLDCNYVTSGYVDNIGLSLIAGERLPAIPASDSATNYALINERAVAILGLNSPEEAIGQTLEEAAELHFNPDDVGSRIIIKGVIKDFHYQTLMNPQSGIGPYALVQDPTQIGYANVKIDGSNLTKTMTSMVEIWETMEHPFPLQYTFFDEEVMESYKFFTMATQILGFLGFLAIIISCMGLLGMVTYAVEGKMKEVGIRKVLGATEQGLIWKLSREFAILLGIAMFIAGPLAWFANNIWLDQFSIRIPVGLNVFLPGLGLVLLLSLIVVVTQTWHAARSNPVDVLGEE